MALESGTYISDLNAINPANTDGVTQADDHLRLLKSTVKATFPNVSGAVTPTHTELNYVDGVTSAIQTQLDALTAGKQPLDADLTAIAGLTSAANKLPYFTGAGTAAVADLTVYARTLLDDADAATARTTLGLGSLAVLNTADVASVPTGSLFPYAGASAPAGYLFCFGQAVSRATYSALFTALSTLHGAGDGSTTFNLPDLRGRVAAGKDDMGGTSAARLNSIASTTIGTAGGLQSHTLAETEIPAHRHFIAANATEVSSPALSASNYVAYRKSDTNNSPNYTLIGTIDVDATLGLSGATGGGSAHNNVQPTIILNYIIKT